MANWPNKLLLDDFEETLIKYMSAPIGGSSVNINTGTLTSSGILYVPKGMTNSQIIDYKGTSSP